MRFQLKKSLASLLLSGAVSLAWTACASADTSIDFHKTIVPILKDSCYACHVPGAAAPSVSQDPILLKKIKKEIGDGVNALTMGDKFPFADDDPAAKQLKHLEKELTKQMMPPEAQAKLGLGLPLSDKNRKILLDWVAQQKKLVQ
jgi:hypothetical protein